MQIRLVVRTDAEKHWFGPRVAGNAAISRSSHPMYLSSPPPWSSLLCSIYFKEELFMDKAAVTMRVFFEEPFWVGVAERIVDQKLSVCRIVFGAEPKDYEILEFLLKNYYKLRFSPAVKTAVKESAQNPKRVQREIQKQMQSIGIGTKSQQALKLMQEQMKVERKTFSREQKEAEKQRQFDLKQLKKKEKHRGR